MSPEKGYRFTPVVQVQKDADLALRDALTTDAEILLDSMLRLLGGSNVSVQTVHHYERQLQLWKKQKRQIADLDAPKLTEVPKLERGAV